MIGENMTKFVVFRIPIRYNKNNPINFFLFIVDLVPNGA